MWGVLIYGYSCPATVKRFTMNSKRRSTGLLPLITGWLDAWITSPIGTAITPPVSPVPSSVVGYNEPTPQPTPISSEPPNTQLFKPLEFVYEEQARRKQASGRLRGNRGVIVLPRHWPLSLKTQARSELEQKLTLLYQKQCNSLYTLQQAYTPSSDPLREGPVLTLRHLEEVEHYVRQLNGETFQAPVKQVRIGWAKYSRLAQVNIRTGTLTISRHCLGEAVPAAAFRYLVLHELAHFYEVNHSARFWALVEQHCPDYRTQRTIMRHYFHYNVLQHDQT
jgi:hypothetical protein